MRLLLEIIIVGALIYIGWATPFRDYLPASISGVAKSPNASAARHQTAAPQPRLRPIARSTSIPSGSWMWDPNHHSTLDRPTPKRRP
ncbi:MAG TPA: hypothetical protein VN827_00960 [Chthoniobacterales bacterium]|nr:hypothetical protein [Chthoniobacterales bacterium]